MMIVVLRNILPLAAALLYSCGQNYLEDSNPNVVEVEKAAKLMEDDEPVKAIELLLNYMGQSFRNAYNLTDNTALTATFAAAIAESNKSDINVAVTLLSQAQAQWFGLDPLKVAIKLGTNSGDSSTNTDAGSQSEANKLTELFPVLPAATDANLAGLEKASAILASLGGAMTDADIFKSALLVTSSVALRTKKLDADGDGNISLLETTSLSPEDATSIITQIAQAAATANGVSLEGEGSASQAGNSIQELLTEIRSEEGTSDEEQLRNFFAQSDGTEIPADAADQIPSDAADQISNLDQ